MKFHELFHRWLPQAEIASWEGFGAELDKRLAGKEQELRQVVAQATEELQWSLDLTGEPYLTLATGLRVKPLGGNQFEKLNPEGQWIKANARRDLNSGELLALQGLSDLFLEVAGLRRAREELPAALAEFKEVYQISLAALRGADPMGGVEEVLQAAKEFHAEQKPVLPAAASREYLGALRQLLQGGFVRAHSTGDTDQFRQELTGFFRRHREEGAVIPPKWEEEFFQEEHRKEYLRGLEELRMAAAEAEIEQAKKGLDSLLRQYADHLSADARSEVAAAYDQAWQNFPPAPPVKLQATRANENGITISWDKARGAAGYRVYRADARTGEDRTLVGCLQATTSLTASLVDPEVEPDRDFFYWVTAGNAKGEVECAEPVTGRRKKQEGPAPGQILELARIYAEEANPGSITDLIRQNRGLTEQLEPLRGLAQQRETALREATVAETEGDVLKMVGIYRDDLPFAKGFIDSLQGAVDQRLFLSEEEKDAAREAGEVETLKAKHREMEVKLNELLELDKDVRRSARITALIRRNRRFLKDLEGGQSRRGQRTARPGEAEAVREQQHQTALAAGRAALTAGNFAEAIRQAELALAAKPDGPEAQKLKAEAGREQKYQTALAAACAALTANNFAEAIQQAELALATKPDDIEAWEIEADARRKVREETQLGLKHKHQLALASGRAALAAGNFTEALQQADLALTAKPDDPEARKLKAEAEGALQVAAEREQEYRLALAAGRAALAAGNFAEALQQADLALTAKPDDPEARKLKTEAGDALQAAAEREQEYRLALAAGRAALAAGNFAEALQQADLALTAKPEDTEARKLKTEAGDALQAATEREQEYRLAMAAGRAALAAGNFAEALRQADLALATKPDDLEAWRLEADAKRKMMVENQLGLRHKHQQAMAAGRAALTAGNFAVAIEQADVALAAKPNDPEARELREEAEGGRKKLQEESSARDQQYQAAVAAARAALTAGNFAGAIEQADLALAARPEDPEARKLKAEAEGALEEAAAREQQYRLALAAGRTALTAGNFAGAIGQADLALAANPNDPAARQLRQEAEAGRKQLQEASVRDQQFQAALAAGRAALSAGRFAVAVQQADLALAAKPGFPEAQTLKEAAGREQRFKTAMEAGRVALVTSHFVEAIEQADLALTAKPDASEARYLKQEAEDKYRSLQEEAEREQKFQLLLEAGRTALAAGRFVGAVRQADQALAARPNDPEARNLKQAAEAGQKYQLAMEAGRAALTAGHFAGGIGQADLALAARPDDPEARELKQAAETGQKYEMALAAGRAALAAGHFAEAVQQADLALATKPGDSAARELKQEAETGQKYEQAMEEGRAALSAERFGEAIQRFDEALAVRPGAPELLPELRLALQNQIKRLAPGARKRSDLIELESVLKKHDDLFSQGAGRDPRGQTTVLETDLTGLVTHARSRVETQRKKLGRLVMVAGVVIGVAIGVTAWAVWPVSVSTVMANAHSLALNGNIPGIEQLETKYPHLKARLDAELVQARSVVGDVLAKAQNEAANLAVEDIDKLIIDHPGLKPQLDPLRAEAASKLKEIEDEAKAAFLAADVGAIKEIQDKYPNIKELGIFLTRAESQRTNVLTQANNFAELFDLDSIRSLETKYSKLKAELETILAGAKAKMDNIVAMAKTMAERGDVPGIEQLERQYPQLKPLLDLELNRARGVVRDVRVKGQNDVTNFALEDIDKLITNYPVLKPQLDPLRAEVVSKLKELEGEVENQRTNVLNQAENFAELLDLDAIRSLETTYPKWKPELETILAGAKAKVDNVEASATTMAKKGDVQGIERLEEQYPKLMSQLAPLHAAAVTEARRIIELQYQTAMTAGHKALEDGNNAEAGKQADLALKLKPGDTDALNLKDAAKKSAIDPDVDKFLTINNLYPNRKSLPMSFVYVAANGSWPGGLIGASPVTLNQFYGSGGDAPVTKRNPLQAEDFCTSLTQKELNAGHILSGWKYRLPKSEEWQSLSNLKPNPLSAPGGKLVIGKLLVPIMNKPYGFFHNSSSDPTGNPTPSFADASDVSTNVVIKVVLVNK